MKDTQYSTIVPRQEGRVLWVILNRPQVHNAFNAHMIDEMNALFDDIKGAEDVRVIVLTGEGKSFCAGADLNWMREIVNYSFEQNMEESLNIAELMQKIYALPKPTVAMVNGAAIGGGTGFVSACDIAYAADSARFGLSEVKIGLVPAAISPFVIRKIGESMAREYFLTGQRLTAERALTIGLVNAVYPGDELKSAVDGLIENLLTSGPEAIASCKELLYKVPRMRTAEVKEFTARMIAELRVSAEGQEGMAAFLEKRKPNWIE
ncbi:MAG: enoyl-CoA hydratase/isomerase family protein [Acidobacteriota bacterium]